MTNLDTLNSGDLYEEIADLARNEGVTDQAEWNELCDEVIDSHMEIGELSVSEDLESLRQALHLSWSEYSRESGPESANAVAEDPTSPHI